MREPLTPREQEAFDLYTAGNRLGEVAQLMGITKRGARWHLDRCRVKFGVTHRHELVKIGQSYGKGTQ